MQVINYEGACLLQISKTYRQMSESLSEWDLCERKNNHSTGESITNWFVSWCRILGDLKRCGGGGRCGGSVRCGYCWLLGHWNGSEGSPTSCCRSFFRWNGDLDLVSFKSWQVSLMGPYHFSDRDARTTKRSWSQQFPLPACIRIVEVRSTRDRIDVCLKYMRR